MEDTNRKQDEQQPRNTSSTKEKLEPEKLPSFRNLMAEIHGALASSPIQEGHSSQMTQRIHKGKRPRVEAPLYVNIESQEPYEISPVSPFPGTRITEYSIPGNVEHVGETLQESGKSCEGKSVLSKEGKFAEHFQTAKEARIHRRQILQAKRATTVRIERVPKSQQTGMSLEQTSPVVTVEGESTRTPVVSSETSTSLETEGVGGGETSSQTVRKQAETEEEQETTKSIKESEAGPSSVPSLKRGRGRKREHPEWTEEQRQAQRIMKNREVWHSPNISITGMLCIAMFRLRNELVRRGKKEKKVYYENSPLRWREIGNSNKKFKDCAVF